MTKFKISTFEVRNYHNENNLDPLDRHTDYSHNENFFAESESLEQVQKALELLGIKYYRVWKLPETRGWEHDDDIIFTSSIITAIDNRRKTEREAYDQKQTLKVEELNKLSNLIQEWDFGKGYKIQINKGEAKYVRSYSHNIQFPLSINLFTPDGKDAHFWFTRYISEDGKVLRKSFIDSNQYTIRDKEVILAVVGKIKEIYTAYKNFEQKWR